jgi:hypothetical protein
LAGAWRIVYADNSARTYEIDAKGGVLFVEEDIGGQLRRGPQGLLLELASGQPERLRFDGNTVTVERFASRAAFGNEKPVLTGTGTRKGQAPPPSAPAPPPVSPTPAPASKPAPPPAVAAEKPAAVRNASQPPNALVIEALVDGPSELRVNRTGLYWINRRNAKPGKHEGRNEPTYINGATWQPLWKHPDKERGDDRSDPYDFAKPLDPSRLDFKLLAVGRHRDSGQIEKRSPIQVQMLGQELSIVIPDPERGPRWYKFSLVPTLPRTSPVR